MVARTMGPRDWALLALLSLLWGGSFFFVEIAVRSIPPLTLVLARVGLAAAVLLLIVRWRGLALPAAPGRWLSLVVMGALNNVVPFSLIAWAQSELASGIAAILNATTPLFTILLAHLVTSDEKLTANRLAGVVLGLAGVAIMIGPDALAGVNLAAASQLAVLAAALSYACAGLYGRRLRGLPSSVAAAGMLAGATVTLLPVALFVEGPPTVPPEPLTLAALAGLALLSTAAAYLIYFRLLKSAGASNLLLVTFLIPVTALLLGIGLLGERPDWTAFAGMALIGLGLLAVDGRALRLLAPRRALPGRPPNA